MINYSLQDVGGGVPAPRNNFANTFMAIFQQAMEMRRQQEAIQTAQEERDYRRDAHKHEIKRLDLEEKRQQLEARLRAAGLNYGTGDTPTLDLSGFEDLGFPSMQYKPPTFAETLAMATRKGHVDAGAAYEKNQAENAVDLSPNISSMFESEGANIPPGRYHKALIEPLMKMMLDKVEVPAMPGGSGMGPAGVPPGRYDKEALSLFNTQYDKNTVSATTKATEAGQNTRAGLQRQNNLDVANVYANHQGGRYGTGAGADETAVQEWAKRLSTAQAKMSEVPMGLRNLVVKQMGYDGNAIMTPALMEKFSQFIPAKAALDELEAATNAYADSSFSDNPVDAATKALLLKNKVAAFSRLVGRATGEKGVFTEGDKGDFMNYIAPLGLLGATVSPDLARQAIGNARTLMSKIETNNFKLASTPHPMPGGPTPQPTPSPAAGGQQPIVQRNSETGEYRYSLDGGLTWRPGQPGGF